MNKLLNFDDFITSLSQEDKDYISGINDKNPDVFEGNLASPDDLLKFIGFMNEFHYQKTLRLLDLYTDWLNTSLQN